MTASNKLLPLDKLLEQKSVDDWPIYYGEDLPRRSLVDSLKNRQSSIAIIGEVRQLAPYGQPAKYGPDELIEFYAERADAINVLTENRQFGGQLDWLVKAKSSSQPPIMCLDLVGNEKAIESIRSFQADAVILIARLLKQKQLVRLCKAAQDYELEVVVEVQDINEANRALEANTDVVGVNTRCIDNLHQIDLGLPERIIPALPPSTLTIAESGIKTPADLKKYIGLVDAALIGSAFVESKNIAEVFEAFNSVR